MSGISGYVSEAAAKAQAVGGSVVAAGGAGWAFLADNYLAFAALGAVVASCVAIHGAFWYDRIKRQQSKINRQQEEINELEISRRRAELR